MHPIYNFLPFFIIAVAVVSLSSMLLLMYLLCQVFGKCKKKKRLNECIDILPTRGIETASLNSGSDIIFQSIKLE